MADENKTTPAQDNNEKHNNMNIDVQHLSAGGNVVFSGRDSFISANAGGDFDSQNSTRILVGGVNASQQEYEQLMTALQNVASAIEASKLDDETREEAQFHRATIQQQLTSKRPPNGKILVRAAKRLFKLSPLIAGALMSVFSESVVGQMLISVGGTAQQFYERLKTRMEDG